MKKLTLLIFVAVVFIAIAASVVIINSSLAPEDSSAAISTNPNLKYFGYMGVDKVQYVNEVSALGNNNINHFSAPVVINTSSGPLYEVNKTELKELMAAYKQKNMKAIIGVDWVLFADLKVNGNGKGAVLATNWEKRWSDFLEGIKGYEDNIYALYFDEPYFNGISKQQMQQVLIKLRFDMPRTNLMIVEAYTVIEDSLKAYSEILDYVTDYGFDYYFTQYPNATYAQYLNYYNKMIAALPTRMKVWLIPDGFAYNTGTINSLARNFDLYSTLASNDKRVVGVLNFIYMSSDTSLGYHIKDLFSSSSKGYSKELRSKHFTFGRQVTTLQRRLKIEPCTSYSYSNWSACKNGTQTRFLVSRGPFACEGGSPVLTQVCEPELK